jgi:hypothetical protein
VGSVVPAEAQRILWPAAARARQSGQMMKADAAKADISARRVKLMMALPDIAAPSR